MSTAQAIVRIHETEPAILCRTGPVADQWFFSYWILAADENLSETPIVLHRDGAPTILLNCLLPDPAWVVDDTLAVMGWSRSKQQIFRLPEQPPSVDIDALVGDKSGWTTRFVLDTLKCAATDNRITTHRESDITPDRLEGNGHLGFGTVQSPIRGRLELLLGAARLAGWGEGK